MFCPVRPLSLCHVVTFTCPEEAATTVSVIEPSTGLSLASIVVDPIPVPVARPFDPAVLLIVATVEDEELHVTEVVRSWVLLSEYVPVALKCSITPFVIVGLAGVTLSEVRVDDTVSIVDPEIPFRAAWIVAFPGPTLVANPFRPTVLLIVATVEGEELHVTALVRSCVLLSVYVPVALNCSVAPCVIVGFAGVTLSEVRVDDTVSIVDPEIPFRAAWIVAFPGPTLVANPFRPTVLLIVATVEGEELHVTALVRSCVLLSEYVPVALNCWFEP